MGDEAFARRFFADRTRAEGAGRADRLDPRRVHRRGAVQPARGALLPAAGRAAPTTSWPRCRRACTCSRASSPTPSRCAWRCRTWPSAGPTPRSTRARRRPRSSSWPAATRAEVAQRLAKLEQAISQAAHRALHLLDDRAPTPRPSARVNPYGLWELNGVWYVVGDDLDRPAEDPDRRRTFRVSRIRGEIKFATRRERDFRMPADFNVTAYRDRAAVDAGRRGGRRGRRWPSPPTRPAGRAPLRRLRRVRGAGRRLGPLHDRLLRARARCRPGSCRWAAGWCRVEPAGAVDAVAADLQAVGRRPRGPGADAAARRPSPRRAGREPAPQPRGPSVGRARALRAAAGPARLPARRAAARALGRGSRRPSSRRASSSGPQELKESLELLNLVNFGGGCYAVYCSTDNGDVRRRQGALRRRLPPPGPALAARGQGAPAGAGRGRAAGRRRGAQLAARRSAPRSRPRSGASRSPTRRCPSTRTPRSRR